jgi:hypothetical protein
MKATNKEYKLLVSYPANMYFTANLDADLTKAIGRPPTTSAIGIHKRELEWVFKKETDAQYALSRVPLYVKKHRIDSSVEINESAGGRPIKEGSCTLLRELLFEMEPEIELANMRAKIADLKKEKDQLVKRSAAFVQSGVAPQFKNHYDRIQSAIADLKQKIEQLPSRQAAHQQSEKHREELKHILNTPEYKEKQKQAEHVRQAITQGMEYWKDLRNQYGSELNLVKEFIKIGMKLTNQGKKELSVDELAKHFDVPARTMYKWLNRPDLKVLRTLMPRSTH